MQLDDRFSDKPRPSMILYGVLLAVTLGFLCVGAVGWLLQVNMAEKRMNGIGRAITLTPAELEFRKLYWGGRCAASGAALVYTAVLYRRYPLTTGCLNIFLWLLTWGAAAMRSTLLDTYLHRFGSP